MNISIELKNALTSYCTGNAEAFNTIYEESKDYIYNCIYKVMHNDPNAGEVSKEIFNDTFVEISRSVYQLQDPEKYFSWAGTIASRKCIDYLRKNKHLELEMPLQEEYPDDDNIIPEVIMQNREKQLLVKQIIDTQLSEMEKLCIVAYYYHELPQPEIAKQLNIPENSVKTHLYRAKKKIKEAVLELEEKKDIKLYSFGPFLLLLLSLELESTHYMAEGTTIAAQIICAAGSPDPAGRINAGNTPKTGNTTPPAGTISKSAAAAKTAGGMMMKTKIIIAAAVVLCIGAVAGTVAIVSNSRDTGSKSHKDKSRDTSITKDLDDAKDKESKKESSAAKEDTSDKVAENKKEDPAPDPAPSASAPNTEGWEILTDQLDEFMEAYQTGDFDTILRYGKPDSKIYPMLSDISKLDGASELFRILYGDMEYMYPAESMEAVMKILKNHDYDLAGNYFNLYVPIVNKDVQHLKCYYTDTLAVGTSFENGFHGGSEENAIQMIKDAVANAPYIYYDCVKFSFSNGQLIVDLDAFMDPGEYNKMNWNWVNTYATDPKYNYGLFRGFVEYHINMDDTIIDPSVAYQAGDHEVNAQIEALILNKDFEGMIAKHEEIKGQPFSEMKIFENTIRYSELSAENQHLLDDIVANEVEVYRDYSASIAFKIKDHQADIIMAFPAERTYRNWQNELTDEVRTWLHDHNAKSVFVERNGEREKKADYLLTLRWTIDSYQLIIGDLTK